VVFGEKNPNDGVNKKIHTQISTLIHLGIEVEMILVVKESLQYPSYDYLTMYTVGASQREKIIERIKRVRDIRRVFRNCVKSLGRDDILYCRYTNLSLFYYSFNYLKKLRLCKLVTEHQTIESNEDKLKNDFLPYICDKIFGGFFRGQSDAIVGVTNEITHYQLIRSGDPNKPHITIGNGIEVKSCSMRQSPIFDGENIDLLCVANVSKWHGLDRLLKGMATYSGNTRIILHIAGEGAELPLLKQLVEKFNLQNRVIFHGFKTGEDLDALFDSCHIAVGSIGIHRIGLNEASILKAREYCARGIPYIIACADPDFQDDFPYIHRVPPDESPADIEKIIEFAQTVCADLDHPRKMRAYALEHLDWSMKMKKLKAFLETLIDEPKPPS